jgi:hypothetical protein
MNSVSFPNSSSVSIEKSISMASHDVLEEIVVDRPWRAPRLPQGVDPDRRGLVEVTTGQDRASVTTGETSGVACEEVHAGV